MFRRHRITRTISATLVGALALAAMSAPAVQAGSGSTTCHVHNITQDTRGGSFNRMVGKAQDGDRLRVRGTCPTHVTIGKDLTIVGVGETRPVLTGQDRRGVLKVKPHANVVLRHLVIKAGREHHDPEQFGGGILNLGTLLVRDSVIRDNEDLGSGGIFNSGRMTLRDSIVRSNHAASSDGGGIANTGTMTVIASLIAGNEAFWDGYDVYPSGGGIANSGTLTLQRSVVRGNTAGVHGGGIYNTGTLSLRGSRVSGNSSWAGGGISNNWGATVTLRSSRVVSNTATSDGGGIWNGFWSPWEDTEPEGAVSAVTLIDSVVRSNAAAHGGGIWNDDDAGGGDGSVTKDAASSVTGNNPDDCVGSPAC